MFIDATYEGDLMAAAGVTYTVGREANKQYGETLNGVQVARADKHQFTACRRSVRQAGRPIERAAAGHEHESAGATARRDKRVQAYNFRMCMTDVPENRVPFQKPVGYDEPSTNCCSATSRRATAASR